MLTVPTDGRFRGCATQRSESQSWALQHPLHQHRGDGH